MSFDVCRGQLSKFLMQIHVSARFMPALRMEHCATVVVTLPISLMLLRQGTSDNGAGISRFAVNRVGCW